MRHNAILRRHTCPRLSGFCKMSSWSLDWKAAQKKADRTARWAVTMSKVRIRRAKCASDECCHGHVGGKAGGESTGFVDLLAVRKDHGTPMAGTKRGDALQIILIQVKGGSAAM